MNFDANGATEPFGGGQFAWRSWVGQRNFLRGDGNYAPYQLAGQSLRYADGEIELLADRQRIVGPRGELTPDMRVFVQYRATPLDAWDFVPHGIPEPDFVQRGDYRGALRLTFPFSALPVIERPQMRVLFEVGCFNHGVMEIQFRASLPGQYRFLLRFEQLLGQPVEVQSGVGPGGRPSRVTAIQFDDFTLGWTYEEAITGRNYRVTDTGGRWQLELLEGPYALTAGQAIVIRPETWGPTNIAADGDDCNQSEGATTVKLQGSALNRLYLTGEFDGDDQYAGFRWLPNINSGTPPTSIDAGTQIDVTNGGDHSTPTDFTPTLYGNNAANTATWSNTNRPDQAVSTTAVENVTGSTATTRTFAVQSIVQELAVTDANAYGGTQGMSFIFNEPTPATANRWWEISYDESHASGTPARLTVVYTVGGGGGSPAFRLSLLGVGR